MAAITITAKTATVYIVRPMAAETLFRSFFLLLKRDPVTSLASELLVFTLKGIVGLSIVIEGPQQPVIGVVAITALLAQAPFVLVLRLVTGETFDIRFLKLGAQMA